jgi:hypothetical protein
MNPTNVHKRFIFNENIDEDQLYSLYEHDYSYIAEVFNGSLESLKEETAHFTSAFESSDLTLLKRTVHKMRPLFGFTGLMHHQEMMARFEHLCENAKNTSNITIQYMELTELINQGKEILKEDLNRLTEFTS